MSELTREQVENWIANVGAPGPVHFALCPGAARRLGESWLRLYDRLAELEPVGPRYLTREKQGPL